jgi:TolB-like protein
MNLERKTTAGVLAISFILLLTGCTNKSLNFNKLGELPEPKICRLAVLPFTSNEEVIPTWNISTYRIFQAELTEFDNFQLVPEGDVRHAYQQIKLLPHTRGPNFEELQILGNYLNVQYLIAGNILELGGIAESGQGRENPSLTIQLRLLDASTGNTLWKTYYRGKGDDYRKVMHFGVVNSTTQLVSLMFKEILERWASEGFIAQCID